MNAEAPTGPVVDARGLRCPIPVIRLAEVARSTAPGTEVTVLWTDPAARYDIPAWARMRGHRLVGTVPFSAVPVRTVPLSTVEPGDGDPGTPAYATTIRLQPSPPQ